MPEPVILAQAYCISDLVTIPYIGTDITKESFGIFVVFIDFAVVFILMAFIFVIDARQKEFIKLFKQKTIEMNDFTVRVKNLPSDGEYGAKEHILKAYLW